MRIGQKFLFSELPIKNSEPTNRQPGHHNIESLVHPWIIKVSSCKSRKEAKVVKRQHEDDVLVKHVQNEVTVSAVGFSPVAEQQVLQESELPDRVVRGSCRLGSFQPVNSDSNVGSRDHVDIVRPVSDC